MRERDGGKRTGRWSALRYLDVMGESGRASRDAHVRKSGRGAPGKFATVQPSLNRSCSNPRFQDLRDATSPRSRLSAQMD
jgi:hypothetical protein